MRLGRDRSPYRHGRIGLGKKKHRFHQSQKYKISEKKNKKKKRAIAHFPISIRIKIIPN